MESVENQIVNAARCGETEAFGRLYESYYATMVWLAYAILLDRNLAEDAAQQAFVKAAEKLGDLKNVNRFGAWLGRICRNEAYQLMRCRQRTPVSLTPQHEPVVDQDPANANDQKHAVKAAVDGLPEMYREIVVLHYYQHLDYRQISQVLGIAEATVWDENGNAMVQTMILFSVSSAFREVHEFMANFQALRPVVRTDDLGHYQLSDLPVGDAQIQVMPEGNLRIRPKKVTLNPGDSVELNFGDEGGLVVTGVVKDGSELLDSVEVELQSMDEDPKARFYAKTDSAGRFKFIHVPGRKYLIAALRPRTEESRQFNDPNDKSHVLYKVIEIQDDLDLTVDYQTRSIE